MFDWMTNAAGNDDIAPYLTLAGGGFSAASSIMAGNENAKLERANAAIAGTQARSETQTGAEQAELYRQHLNATLGRQEAQIGGSGITASGSALRSLEATSILGAQDISRIQTNAARKAWGYETTQAGDLLKAGQSTARGGADAFGQLITSGARAYGQWQSTN